ncbi:heterokaryon incompatibility protein-domain-containing protein [Xylariales sp. PMI_506]|nr:heterokaryon incompatibility protein-domain-containing protein [Xylariales sp. PMI_506]
MLVKVSMDLAARFPKPYWTIEMKDRSQCIIDRGVDSIYPGIVYSLFTSVPSTATDIPSGLRSYQPPSASAFYQNSLDWASAQISNCLAFHENPTCAKAPDSFLPMRLINVWHPDGSEDVILNHKSQIMDGSLYNALSYCWSDSTDNDNNCYSQFMSTYSEFEDNMERIRWSSLPKTFQDSIMFTRGLGVQYLWIDSLCTLQGDRESWAQDPGAITSVYQHAFVTICALWGHDPYSGLFSSREEWHPRLLTVVERGVEAWPLYYRKSHGPFLSWPRTQLQQPGMLARWPLFARAWSQEERLASPRVLYFDTSELGFRCAGYEDCQCGEHRDGVLQRTPQSG